MGLGWVRLLVFEWVMVGEVCREGWCVWVGDWVGGGFEGWGDKWGGWGLLWLCDRGGGGVGIGAWGWGVGGVVRGVCGVVGLGRWGVLGRGMGFMCWVVMVSGCVGFLRGELYVGVDLLFGVGCGFVRVLWRGGCVGVGGGGVVYGGWGGDVWLWECVGGFVGCWWMGGGCNWGVTAGVVGGGVCGRWVLVCGFGVVCWGVGEWGAVGCGGGCVFCWVL